MDRWELSDEVRDKYKPIIQEFLTKVGSLTPEYTVDEELLTLQLSNTELNPYTLRSLLKEEFDYGDEEMKRNGWELDFWIYLGRSKDSSDDLPRNLCIHGCGMIFELNLSVGESGT